MTRAPRLGVGKTRLRGVLSDQARLSLQEAFARDAVAVALEADVGPVYLAYAPAGAASWAEREFCDRVTSFAQQGDELGARMLAALCQVAAQGLSPLLMIGTDAPLLQPNHLPLALAALRDTDLCLGPSADGGYYLLACRTVTPQLFEGVRWGRSDVLEATLRRAIESGLRSSLIEMLYDVDTPEDLAHLRQELAVLAKKPSFRLPQHTAAALLA